MGLSGALASAISSLNAQSSAMAMVSDNLANSQTTAYKTTGPTFEDMVTASSSATSYSSGGVSALASADVTQQGLLTATTTSTNMAIQGQGFFAVTTSPTGGSTLYTRNGDFTVDNNGYLEDNGAYLLGWPTDSTGNVIGGESASSMVPINTDKIATSASATTKTTIAANLPADAATGATFTNNMQVYDSLGTAQSIQVTWTKTGTNAWTGTFADPTLASDASTTTGATTGSIAVTFNSDGTLASTTPSPPTISVTGWTDGAANSTIAMNLGTIGASDGLTQFASGESTPSMSVTAVTSDGLAFGKVTGLSVANGNVDATYSNGQTVAVYKIPIATFQAPDELAAGSDGLYTATAGSGAANIQASATGSAGTIFGSELESSATDTNQAFSAMIAAQQAYTSSAQVITTVDKMFDTLINDLR
jgi:flagellar hook protein FlgE